MNRGRDVVRVGSDDRKGIEGRVVRGRPSFPDASEREQLTILQAERIRLFCLGVDFLPLIKGIGRHKARSDWIMKQRVSND